MSKHERKKTDILNRIKSIEGDIVKAEEFLATGANGHWHIRPPQALQSLPYAL